MKIQVTHKGITATLEDEDLTVDMVKSVYELINAGPKSQLLVTHLDGNALKVAIQRDGYKEYVSGLKRENPEVVHDSPTVKKVVEQHQTMAEKGFVNSPDKSPFAAGGVFNHAVHAI